MMMSEEMCQTCKFCTQEGPDYYMCGNEDSEFFGLETISTDYCEDYECKYGKWKGE